MNHWCNHCQQSISIQTLALARGHNHYHQLEIIKTSFFNTFPNKFNSIFHNNCSNSFRNSLCHSKLLWCIHRSSLSRNYMFRQPLQSNQNCQQLIFRLRSKYHLIRIQHQLYLSQGPIHQLNLLSSNRNHIRQPYLSSNRNRMRQLDQSRITEIQSSYSNKFSTQIEISPWYFQNCNEKWCRLHQTVALENKK